MRTTIVALLLGIQHYGERPKSYDVVQGDFIIPDLPRRQFVQKGDINIGALLSLSDRIPGKLCDDRLKSLPAIRYPEAMAYSIERINNEGILPRNITLGFVVLDDCDRESAVSAQAMAFVPQTSCPASSAKAASLPAHDVVAVIGCANSPLSVAAANVLGPARIPLVSHQATSDILSDKDDFPYFLRTITPNKFQFRAIQSIIQIFGWTYISVIYMEGIYGENGFKNLKSYFEENGICLAATHQVTTEIPDQEANIVANDLVKHENARVVIIIADRTIAYKIIRTTAKKKAVGHFIWIGSDAWSGNIARLVELGNMSLGAFLVRPFSTSVPEFEDWLKNQTLSNNLDPWFGEFWEKLFKCSLNNKTCDPSLTVGDSNLTFETFGSLGSMVDTVYMIANATSRLLQSPACLNLSNADVRQCIDGPGLLEELKSTKQPGISGWLELNKQYDRLGRYVVHQVVTSKEPWGEMPLDSVEVVEFDALTPQKMKMMGNVTWIYHSNQSQQPESRCSHYCGPHQARIMEKVKCCWSCQPCRGNEQLVHNGSLCEACPPFTWPDPATNWSTCLNIPPDAPRIDSALGVLQISLALILLLACLAVAIFIYIHRQCRIVKASSRELSFMMLFAIGLGYMLLATLLAEPSNVTCRLNFLLYCISFTLIYGPLLVRALRIFRIFEAGKTSAQRPRMIDSRYQIIFSLVFLSVQVVICVIVMVIYPEWYKLTQFTSQEKVVELTCDIPLEGLSAFLLYNLLLVAICTFLAFKTRLLPDNFNESRFISMCVSTTLVILLCFIPAYLVSVKQLVKMQLLALAVALNHTVALVFLFLPKIYAVYYMQGASDINQTFSRRDTIATVATNAASVKSRLSSDATSNALNRNSVVTEAAAEGLSDIEETSFEPSPNFKQVHPIS